MKGTNLKTNKKIKQFIWKVFFKLFVCTFIKSNNKGYYNEDLRRRL